MAPAIPDRWLDYEPLGKRIAGTRFIAFKVPLRKDLVKSVKENVRLDDEILLRMIPNLGFIIDLTNTDRFYNPNVFTRAGVEYNKLRVPGKVTPETYLVKQFKIYVKDFLRNNGDNDKLIGVHCTHGVNRTGFFICNYMISEMKLDAKEAISRFETARGHHIERNNYIQSLKNLNPSSVASFSNLSSRIFGNDQFGRVNDRRRNTHDRSEHKDRKPLITNWRAREERRVPLESDRRSGEERRALLESDRRSREDRIPAESNWRSQEFREKNNRPRVYARNPPDTKHQLHRQTGYERRQRHASPRDYKRDHSHER